jgi:CheY-like chemotaxis protein
MSEARALPSILVVDDESANVSTFCRMFRKEFTVHSATSGELGLELLGRHEIDVIISDYAMPRMNGLEFLKRAFARKPEIGAIILTGHGDLPELRAAQASGVVVTVLPKPYDRAGVLHWVQQTLRVTRMRRSIGAMNQSFAGRAR